MIFRVGVCRLYFFLSKNNRKLLTIKTISYILVYEKQIYKKGDKQMNKNQIAFRLKENRERIGKSQSEIAEYLGVTQAVVSYYENGTRIPSDEIKIKYAELFKKSVNMLFYSNKE